MQRHIRAFAPIAAALCLLAASHAVVNAQAVMGAGTPANCVQNAGNGELACGTGATAAPGTGATAIGIDAKATADAAMAFGYKANAGAISAMAFGENAAVSGMGGMAVGQGAVSNGAAAAAFGFAARALANETTAVGDTATAQGANSTAIGSNAVAQGANSMALGFGAQAPAANQIVLGTATNIYQLPGVTSAASKAALKGPLKMLVVDSQGNIGVADIPTCRCPVKPVPIKKLKNKG